MLMLISMMISLTLMFILMKHPLSMGGMLLMQIIVISMITGIISLNFWFSYILFIVMVGGLLVLFIYMTSVASNEKISFMKMKFFTIMILMFMLIWIFMDFFMNYFNLNNMDLFKFNYKFIFELCLNKYIYYPSYMMFILMMFYLLIVLIAVVKITNFNKGPLKQKF